MKDTLLSTVNVSSNGYVRPTTDDSEVSLLNIYSRKAQSTSYNYNIHRRDLGGGAA
jgi:hypothetical protein